MERCAVIFATIIINFVLLVLCQREIASVTAQSDAFTPASYPTIREGCDYRERKEKLRKKLQDRVAAKFDEDNKLREKIIDDLLKLLKKDQEEKIRGCLTDSFIIGGEEGDHYKRWCNLFSYQVTVPRYTASLTFFKRPYEHMAVLGWRRTNNTISWHCGATLIHKDFVITAAHCIFNTGKPPDLVRMHEKNLLRGGPDTNTIDYNIEKIVTHEQYKTKEYYNDIALLKIKRMPEFIEKQPPLPACIWTENNYPATSFKVLGFGAPSFGKEYVLVLKVYNLTLFDGAECSRIYEDVEELPRGMLESQLCASDPAGIGDTCEGDSGGPLQFNLVDEYETPYLIGITSFGRQCYGGTPGVYTKIYSFLDWIEKNLKEMM